MFLRCSSYLATSKDTIVSDLDGNAQFKASLWQAYSPTTNKKTNTKRFAGTYRALFKLLVKLCALTNFFPSDMAQLVASEYATEGIFSMKSGVYSFGALLLEIVIGVRIKLCWSHQ